MALEVSRHLCGEVTLIKLALPDRRGPREVAEQWLFMRSVELCLYGGTSGAVNKLLGRVSLARAPMTLKAASVGTLCTRAEYDALLILFEEDLPFESRGRVRNMTLLAVNHALTAARALGRGPRTIAFVQALGTLPELWVAQAEQEANRARLEEDLLLNDRIEELELEEESCHIATELVQYVPLAGDAEDDEKATSWTLPSVPAALKAELDAYSLHRTEPLNRQRDGSAVVDITVGSDRATTLRFLGWLAAERQITPGLGVFCRAALSQWAEDYAKALADKGLKYSSIANYLNGLAMVCQFVYQTYEVDADALAMPTPPLDELLRLRGQCESQAKQQQLYSRRDANWIEWPDAQKARMAAEAAFRALPTTAAPARKLQALKEWLLLSLHTVQPPDRVGVVRKLRLGVTLKKEGGSYTLDMTQARYKTSRFYGPSITSMSALLTEPLDAYLAAFQWETHGNETPYLFHPTSDTTRCLPSSQWSAVVKACFKKHSPGHVAPPPKLLRASFITWLRDSTDAPDVLKAAAKAMRHKEATQQSDRYDKASHDRLTAAATGFLERYVQSLGGAVGGAAGGSASGSGGGNALDEWEPLEPRTSHRFTMVADGKFETHVEWLDGMEPGATMRWATVPGKSDGLTWRVPSEPSVVGRTLKIATESVAQRSFTVEALMRKRGVGEEGSGGSPPGPQDEAPSNLLVRWHYEGAREELHGAQVAPVGAHVHDDVFGPAVLLGEEPGKLLLRVDGEDKARTSGHVYFEPPAMPLAPTELASEPPDVDAAPDAAPPTDAEIAAAFAEQQVAWTDDEQTTLQGAAATDVDALGRFLDRMGVGHVTLLVPDRRYVFARSEYGAHALNCTSEPLEADGGFDDGFDEGFDGPAADEAAVPLAEMPYAAANLALPPGGESPVANIDQQLQVAEQLGERGAQHALVEGYDAPQEAIAVGADAGELASVAAHDEAEEAAAVAVVAEEPPRKRARKSPEEAEAARVAKAAAQKKAARDVVAAAKKAERDAAAAEKAAAREAAAAARATAKLAQPKPSHDAKRIEEAAARAAAQAVAQAMQAMGVQPRRVAKRAPRKRASKKGAASKKAAPRVSAALPAPAPPPPPSRSGRQPKRTERFEADMAGPASAFRSAPMARKASLDPSVDMGVPGYALPGNDVYAMGLRAGVRMRFRARVISLRKQFPRIVVRYTATEDGTGASALALPEMKTAYLTMADVWASDW